MSFTLKEYYESVCSDLYDFTDKETNANIYVFYQINRCQAMFRWKNLPPDIPARDLELMLQAHGYVIFTDKPDGIFRIFRAGLGGMPDYLYRPTLATIANPALEWSANLKIGEECILVPNDTLLLGLLPMHRRYASMLVENDISLRLANINTRSVALISAQDDRTRDSAEKYLEQIEDGDLGIVAETPFLEEAVRVQPFNQAGVSSNIINLMEYQQFLKASWLNDLGLDASSNLKREYVNESELSLNGDMQLSFMDDMLRNRLRACEMINDLYGLDITCELNSAWEDNQQIVTNITEGLDRDMDGSVLDEPEPSTSNEQTINTENPDTSLLEESETRAEEVKEEVEEENITQEEVDEMTEPIDKEDKEDEIKTQEGEDD